MLCENSASVFNLCNIFLNDKRIAVPFQFFFLLPIVIFPQSVTGFQTRSRSRSRSRSPARRRSRSRSPARTTRRSSSRTAAAVAATAITESTPSSRRDTRLKDTVEVRLSPVVSAYAALSLSDYRILVIVKNMIRRS